jgi:bacterial/archaeal transporter family-2 protein
LTEVKMNAFAIPFLLLVGGLLALQAAANVQLSAAAGSPAAGATLQLAVGATVLLAVAAAAGTLTALTLHAPLWHLLGGLGSALYISAGILLFPRLGAVLTVGLLIAGQMLTSLVLDTAGWLGVEQEPLTATALAGTAAVIAGAALIAGAPKHVPWMGLAVLAGAALPVQGAVNAQLRADLDAPLTAALWSFVVATATMALILAATRPPRPRPAQLTRLPWWAWLGGLCGATYVTSVFLLIPRIGVAPTVALTVAGQQLASVLVDRHGWLRLPKRAITPQRLAGVATILAGVALLSQ